jgi:GTP-binding protein EngB required for normal cell division
MDPPTSSNNILSGVLSYFSSSSTPEMGLKLLANQEILKINNGINEIFAVRNDGKGSAHLEAPCLVVVGTQSSGKSTFLNKITNRKILPTGSSMVTRTPLQMNLINHPTEDKIEIGNCKNGISTIEMTMKLSTPMTNQECDKIREEIEKQTKILAGNNFGISFQPIIVKIYSPSVPNLSLIDLPGLTCVAQTDRGQPLDTPEKIQELVGSYIKSERTIILAVVAARPDLEADLALGVIKKYDPHYQRTIGVITKTDLMNKDDDISKYLSGTISGNLQTKFGYFAVHNKTSTDTEKSGLQDSFIEEKKYFASHPVYSKIKEQDRLGVPNLVQHLSGILTEHVRKFLPEVNQELIKMQQDVDHKLSALGSSLPADLESKMTIVNTLINNLCKQFIASLEEEGHALNIGRHIKDTFVEFRNVVQRIEPFNTKEYPDEYIVSVIRNCEGNHMPYSVPPIKVMERCLRDPTHRPFQLLKEPSIICLQKIYARLLTLITNLLTQDDIARFPKLATRIRDEILTLFNSCQKECLAMIEYEIKKDENYIWTDDAGFFKDLVETKGATDAKTIRPLLSRYFNTVKYIIEHGIPKLIMLLFVQKIEDSISSILFDKLMSRTTTISDLLQEAGEVAEKRRLYESQRVKIASARKIIDSAL